MLSPDHTRIYFESTNQSANQSISQSISWSISQSTNGFDSGAYLFIGVAGGWRELCQGFALIVGQCWQLTTLDLHYKYVCSNCPITVALCQFRNCRVVNFVTVYTMYVYTHTYIICFPIHPLGYIVVRIVLNYGVHVLMCFSVSCTQRILTTTAHGWVIVHVHVVITWYMLQPVCVYVVQTVNY